ncbi:MAG: hypothetical protein F9B45_18135 [Phycisphaera sp. RhM]|nr:hypothetical protein [Phycisphaera sp. RhM]
MSRAREITCDRFGLLVCQDLPSATRALFKVATGLDDRWATFNEWRYAEYYDRLTVSPFVACGVSTWCPKKNAKTVS